MSNVDWQALEHVLAAVPNLIAAWVFGSAQSGHIRSGGDVDIGLLYAQKPSLDELVDLRADLQDALHFDEIDLVVLNDRSPLLRFEAISGKLIFCRDAGKRADFASLTAREYEDDMAMVSRALRQLVLT